MSGGTDTALARSAQDGHGETMDGVYALQRHFYDLTRKYYLLGRDRLITQLAPPNGGHVLELGCGTARNMVLASKRHPGAVFHGLDISAEMLKTACRQLERAGVAARCELALADATAFDAGALFGRTEYDRVFCSYTLSMIPNWEKALQIGASLLAPGGELHVVDFGQQARLPRWFANMLNAWLARFHVTPRAQLFPLAEELAERLDLTCRTTSLYRDYARAAVLTRP